MLRALNSMQKTLENVDIGSFLDQIPKNNSQQPCSILDFKLNTVLVLEVIYSNLQQLSHTSYRIFIKELQNLDPQNLGKVQEYYIDHFLNYPIFYLIEVALQFKFGQLLSKCQSELLLEQFEQLNYNRFYVLQCQEFSFDWILQEHKYSVQNLLIKGINKAFLENLIKQFCLANSLGEEKIIFFKYKIQIIKKKKNSFSHSKNSSQENTNIQLIKFKKDQNNRDLLKSNLQLWKQIIEVQEICNTGNKQLTNIGKSLIRINKKLEICQKVLNSQKAKIAILENNLKSFKTHSKTKKNRKQVSF